MKKDAETLPEPDEELVDELEDEPDEEPEEDELEDELEEDVEPEELVEPDEELPEPELLELDVLEEAPPPPPQAAIAIDKASSRARRIRFIAVSWNGVTKGREV